MAVVLGRKPGSGGGPGGGVTSFAKSGDGALTGAVTLSEGANVTLTQVGQDIEIAASGGGGGMELIEDILLGAETASFDFQNIPQTFRNLQIMFTARCTTVAATQSVDMRFNNSSGAEYGSHFMNVVNVTAGAGSNSNGGDTAMDIGLTVGTTADSGAQGSGTIWVYNYAVSGTFAKHVEALGACIPTGAIGNGWITRHHHGVWNSSAAISRITIFPNANAWIAGSRATLYGII